MMKVILFASLAEYTGINEIVVSDISTIKALREFLEKRYPEISRFKFSIAVNKSIVNDNINLNDSDEVALLPPFSGG